MIKKTDLVTATCIKWSILILTQTWPARCSTSYAETADDMFDAIRNANSGQILAIKKINKSRTDSHGRSSFNGGQGQMT